MTGLESFTPISVSNGMEIINGSVITGTVADGYTPTHFTILLIWSNTVTKNYVYAFRLLDLQLRNMYNSCGTSTMFLRIEYRNRISNCATVTFI